MKQGGRVSGKDIGKGLVEGFEFPDGVGAQEAPVDRQPQLRLEPLCDKETGPIGCRGIGLGQRPDVIILVETERMGRI